MKTKLVSTLLLVVFAAASSVASAQNQDWNDLSNSPFPYTVGSPNVE